MVRLSIKFMLKKLWGKGYTVLAIYSLLTVLLTWPVITYMTTHLPGDGGDDPAIGWNLWWVKYALLNEGQNPFQTDFLFYPIGINLAFYTLTLLNGVTALPLTLNFGVIVASNLHIFFTFVVGGYGAFLLVRYLLAYSCSGQGGYLIWPAAVVAGGFYAFASSKLFYIALGQFNIGSNHWIPFAVLYIIRIRHNPHRLKNSLLAALFLTMQAWAEMTYASFILIFFALDFLFYLSRLLFNSRQNLVPYLQAVVVTGLVFTVGLSPILAQMVPDMLVEGDFLVKGSGFADSFSADLVGFIIPTMHHPLFGEVVSWTGIVSYNKGQHIYIGFVLLALSIFCLISGYRKPHIRFWLAMVFIFGLLSLGPSIIINGYETGIDGPFTILQQLPFFKGNRYPSRYSVMLMLSLSVLAGFALLQIGQRFRRPVTLIFLFVVSLLFLFEHLVLPLPLSDMRTPAPYKIIATDPSDFTVLDIPFAWRNGFRITGALTTQFMFGQFYQTTHQKRLLQGNTSRNPEFKFQYFTNAPILNSLLVLQSGKTLPPSQWEADRAIATDMLRFFNIKYIVVRPESGNSIVTPQAVLPYIEAVFPVEKVHDSATIKIYQVVDRSISKPSLFVDSNSPLAPLYFGEGWGLLSKGKPIVAQRKKVRLILPLTENSQKITIRVRIPSALAGIKPDPNSVYLELNGWHSASQAITDKWQELTFNLPANTAQPGLNNLYLHFSAVTSLPCSEPENDIVDITALSAGQELGDFGYIFVNGCQFSPNERGYNIALIKPKSHIWAANFDTHLDPAASTALVDFVATPMLDKNMWVVVVAADEASNSLSEAAVVALQAIGSDVDLRGCFRCSHAFIRGSGDNKSVESLDRLRPVGITTNLGLTEPNLAAVVDWIRAE